MKNLAEQIYRYRTKNGLSQIELAEKLDVSRQSVSKWETGTAVPELSKIVKLCEIFEISMDEFVMGVKPDEVQTPAPNIIIMQRAPISKKKIAGFIFLAIGLLLEILLIFVEHLDPFSCIIWAIPFAVCTAICLSDRKKAAFLCVWTWGIWTWTLAPFVFGMPWLLFPLLLILVIISLCSFRDHSFSLSKKWLALYIIGTVISAVLVPTVHFLTPWIQDAVLRIHGWDSSSVMMQSSLASWITPLLEIALTAVFTVCFVPTFYTIKQKIEEKQ